MRRIGDDRAGARGPAAGAQAPRRHRLQIQQSHERCAALGVSRIERPDFTPVGRADLALARERTRRLLDHAAPVMAMLHEQIAQSESMVVLTDATGTILHSIGDDDFLERASKVALQPGAVWSEQAKGTNAIGTALVDELPSLVHADEHYVHANQFLTCSAAPILDPRGNILGALDVSGDHRSYHPHTMALVRMSARMIENGWLADDHRHVLRLHFHARPDFLGTLVEGILAVAPDGRIVGANRGALEQLGLSGAALRMQTLRSLFGTGVAALVDRFRRPVATPLVAHGPGGRAFHLVARFDWPVWTTRSDAATAQASAVPPQPCAAADVAPAAPQLPAAPALQALCTGDPQVAALVDTLRRVQDRGIPLLLSGEAGSGKEWLARAWHAESARAARPFVALHCEALPPARLEAELFGADGDTPGGGLARARGGTLFLDEVGALPPALQQRLLHALQPLAPTDLALVCASRSPLLERVQAGQFREDLYLQLNGLALRMPPLRARSDLAALAQRLLQDAAAPGRALPLAPDALALLSRQRWPGNLRQLAGALRTAAALATGDTMIRALHLPLDGAGDGPFHAPDRAPDPAPERRLAIDTPPAPDAPPAPGVRRLADLETEAIRRAVEQAGGNISEAAKQLGVSRNTIYRRLRWTRGPSTA